MKALPLGFGLIIAALVSLTIVGLAVIRADIAALQEVSKENVFRPAIQIEREFHALQTAASDYALQSDGDGLAVQRRYDDVLQSLIFLKTAGPVSGGITHQTVHKAVDRLLTQLQALNLVSGRSDDHPLTAEQNVQRLEQLSGNVREITAAVINADEARFSTIRDEMRSGLILTATGVILSMLLSAGAVFIFHRHARQSEMLARKAEEAGVGKARFFSMISHELRTPLNGLLGALNLMRDPPSVPERNRLLDEATGSAQRLSAVLTDALTLGADEHGSGVQTVFSPLDIAAAQKSLLAHELKLTGASLSVEMEKIPVYARGDLAALNNAAVHLIRCLLQRGSVRSVALRIAFTSDTVHLIISCDAESASDVFGETLAQGLLQIIGGSLERLTDGWCLSMPVSRITPTARLYLNSVSMAGLYEKLLKAHGIEIVLSDDDVFDIALTDPVLNTSMRRNLREKHPNSRIISCGPAAPEAGFDAVINSPCDIGILVASALSNPPLAA